MGEEWTFRFFDRPDRQPIQYPPLGQFILDLEALLEIHGLALYDFKMKRTITFPIRSHND